MSGLSMEDQAIVVEVGALLILGVIYLIVIIASVIYGVKKMGIPIKVFLKLFIMCGISAVIMIRIFTYLKG